MSEFKVGDYLVFKGSSKYKGVLLRLINIQLKKVYVPSVIAYGYLLGWNDVRHATPEEIKVGHRL